MNFEPIVIENYFYNLLLGVVILLVGLSIGILAKKILYRILKDLNFNKLAAKSSVYIDVEKGISFAVAFVIYITAIVLFLDQLGIRSIVLYFIGIIVLVVVILSLFVKLKDIIPNFIGWIYLQRQKGIRPGQNIKLQEIAGTIDQVGYMETRMITKAGDILYIPNSLFYILRIKP